MWLIDGLNEWIALLIWLSYFAKQQTPHSNLRFPWTTASLREKLGVGWGKRGMYSAGWSSRENCKMHAEINKELWTFGICRTCKTKIEESKRVRKMFSKNLVRVRTEQVIKTLRSSSCWWLSPRQSLVGHCRWLWTSFPAFSGQFSARSHPF
jgi:hypothetical protein